MIATRLAPIVLLAVVTGCPSTPVGPGRKGKGINPDACGSINTSDIGRKIYAFLQASAELDRATFELEEEVHGACVKMAGVLEIPAEGDTATLCDAVGKEIQNSLEISVSQEQRIVTRTKPPVCETKIEFAADVAAKCEAKVAADIDIQCSGQCYGTCSGRCDGECVGGSGGSECNGECRGVCQGSCSAKCDGAATVDASAECKASAEIRAGVRTECSEPEVEVVTENVTVVDASKLERAVKAISVGMPAILRAGAKAKIVAVSLVHWGKTVVKLAGAGAKVLDEVGERGLCVAGQLAAALAASARISARIDVSVKVSANISASAGAQ